MHTPHRTAGDEKSGESRSYRISTLAGVIVPVVRGDGLVTVDMGTPILEGEALRCCRTEWMASDRVAGIR